MCMTFINTIRSKDITLEQILSTSNNEKLENKSSGLIDQINIFPFRPIEIA